MFFYFCVMQALCRLFLVISHEYRHFYMIYMPFHSNYLPNIVFIVFSTSMFLLIKMPSEFEDIDAMHSEWSRSSRSSFSTIWSSFDYQSLYSSVLGHSTANLCLFNILVFTFFKHLLNFRELKLIEMDRLSFVILCYFFQTMGTQHKSRMAFTISIW